MNQEILDRLNKLHDEYTVLQKMQWKLPSKRSRTANHEQTEQEISNAASTLSRRIGEFKLFCRNHPSYDDEVAQLLSQNDEVENMLFGVNTIVYNPYKRF